MAIKLVHQLDVLKYQSIEFNRYYKKVFLERTKERDFVSIFKRLNSLY